jgi:hypothetical protein
MSRRRSLSVVALSFVVPLVVPWLVVTIGAAPSAHAKAKVDVSENVLAAFRGKLVLSKDAVATSGGDKEVIARLKAAQLRELVGTNGEEGASWRFHFTAFPKKLGESTFKVQFISGENDHRFAADTTLTGLDTASPVLSGDVSISESQGLARGKAYLVQLVTEKGEVVAKTSAIFK